MKQKINIKKFIDKHSEAIAVTVSGVAIIVAFTLGHKIGRHVGEADCNRLWNEACDAADVDRMVLYNAITENGPKLETRIEPAMALSFYPRLDTVRRLP